jgi:hypothetical protein
VLHIEPKNVRIAVLARFLTGSAMGLGVPAKTSPGRQALEGPVASFGNLSHLLQE